MAEVRTITHWISMSAEGMEALRDFQEAVGLGPGPAERIDELRRALSVLLVKQTEGEPDTERLHIAADEALLWYIADDEVIQLFDALQKGYG